MIIVAESAAAFKAFLAKSSLGDLARLMVLRMGVAFMMRHGRMSCSQAAVSVAAEAIHRGQLTRFLARPRWQRHDFNEPLRKRLLAKESKRGRFIFLIDATLVSQAGKKTQNTYSTGNRGRHPAKGRRYNKKKVVFKKCHSFTFGLLITPSGMRIPFQIPHYTQEYCAENGVTHRTTAEAAADMIRALPLPEGADVVVLGSGYGLCDAGVIREACGFRGGLRVDLPRQPRTRLRRAAGTTPPSCDLDSRIRKHLSLRTIRLLLRASGRQVRQVHRRLSAEVAYRDEIETAYLLRPSRNPGGT